MSAGSHQAGIPPRLAAAPLRVIRPRDAADVYRHPRSQLARLEEKGILRRVTYGHYVVVPQDRVGSEWRPGLEAVAAGVGAADFGLTNSPLMGISAARMYGAIPRALTTAIVAVPHKRQLVELLDREATIQFVRRDVGRLDVESVPTELGRALVTTPEQTVLDLARRPQLGGAELEVSDAIRALLPRCSDDTLERLATEQRMMATLHRVRRNQA